MENAAWWCHKAADYLILKYIFQNFSYRKKIMKNAANAARWAPSDATIKFFPANSPLRSLENGILMVSCYDVGNVMYHSVNYWNSLITRVRVWVLKNRMYISGQAPKREYTSSLLFAVEILVLRTDLSIKMPRNIFLSKNKIIQSCKN